MYMASYVIHGGKKLSGSISVNTAKNSAVALLCASLMVKGRVTLYRVPRIDDVHQILDILGSIGVHFEWQNKSTLYLDTSHDLKLEAIDKEACSKIRSSLFLFGALAARVKKYKLSRSGGCKLGERSVRPHMFPLKKLGVHIESKPQSFEVSNKALVGADVVMYESGDMPTENVIMAAVLAQGTTTIKFASANYMVQDLCYFLQEAGAKIEGIGTSTLKIKGVKKLKSVDRYHVMPDPLEAMAFIALAITTKSELTIKNCPLDFLELELEKLHIMGQKYAVKNKRTSKNRKFTIVDITVKPSPLVALPDKLHALPFPGINIDNIPFFVPIATQAKGRTLIHDWMYENRPTHYLPFAKLGAHVELLDTHRVSVEGSTKLVARNLRAPDGIRPAMALCIGLLAAKGTSKLDNIYQIERGYEDLPERLSQIGVRMERVES